MPVEELEKLIFSCGFYHSKAKAIKEASASIVAMGGMPTTREELMKLRGVGRKTANVVYAVAYGGNAIAVDTHVFRVSNRIGIVSARTPEETERPADGGVRRGFVEQTSPSAHLPRTLRLPFAEAELRRVSAERSVQLL